MTKYIPYGVLVILIGVLTYDNMTSDDSYSSIDTTITMNPDTAYVDTLIKDSLVTDSIIPVTDTSSN